MLYRPFAQIRIKCIGTLIFYCLAKMRIDPLCNCYIVVSHLIPGRDYIHAGLKSRVQNVCRSSCGVKVRITIIQTAIDIAFAIKRNEENDVLLRRLLAYALALERLKSDPRPG